MAFPIWLRAGLKDGKSAAAVVAEENARKDAEFAALKAAMAITAALPAPPVAKPTRKGGKSRKK